MILNNDSSQNSINYDHLINEWLINREQNLNNNKIINP